MRTLITITTLCVLFFVNTTLAHARLQPVGPGWGQGERLAKVSPELKGLVSLSRRLMESRVNNRTTQETSAEIEQELLQTSEKIVSRAPKEVRRDAEEYKKGIEDFIRQFHKK